MSKSAILLGSKPASVVALLLLLQKGWNVTEVVASRTQANWLPGPSLFDVASSLGIRTVPNQEDLESSEVDLVVSYMFRSRVSKFTLERGRYPLNFHAGPLPQFGGWAFYNVAILESAVEYGCTCHVMDEEFDTGPLVKVRRFGIDSSAHTAVSLEKRTQIEMLLLFEEVIDVYENVGQIASVPQDAAQMRYLNAAQFAHLKEIPASATPEEADRIARAFWYPPYECAYHLLPNGTRLEVVPQIVQHSSAINLHSTDLEDLLRTARIMPSLVSVIR